MFTCSETKRFHDFIDVVIFCFFKIIFALQSKMLGISGLILDLISIRLWDAARRNNDGQCTLFL